MDEESKELNVDISTIDNCITSLKQIGRNITLKQSGVVRLDIYSNI
jgi:hypothetical protein